MLKLIVYDTIEKKNLLEARVNEPLTSHESLVQCLNMMDFLAVLNPKQERMKEEIAWIVLEQKNDK